MIRIHYPVAIRSIPVAIILNFMGSFSFAQNVTETRWNFGNSSSNLIFDRNGKEVYLQDDQATPFGSTGAVTITDQFTGNLLFYTDGENVYDMSHAVVPSGAGLAGNTTINVPVVTCPFPDNPGQYFLFTNSGSIGVNEIQYSIVNATEVGNGSSQFPYGDVIATNVSIGLSDPSEGMVVISKGDGDLFWLISQNRNTFGIQVTQVDARGVVSTTDYNFTNGALPGFEVSHFAFNQDSSQLVMAPKIANRNIWLMDFDPSTGILTFDRTLTGTGFNDGATESIYDVEWSPNGSKLYVSRFGGGGGSGQLYQIDFNDPTETITPLLTPPVFRSYGLKRAIDNRIYHLYQEVDAMSPFILGRLNRPDSIADSVKYQPAVFSVDFNSRQFPEFTPGYNFTFDTLNFYWIDSCATNVTKFFPIVEPVPNNLTWDFGDGENTDAWIPNHQYEMEGGYMVSLTADINGITQTITQPVEILMNSLMVDLGNDTTICVDEVLTLDAGIGNSFVWSTRETTQTIQVDTTGTYWVEVTDASGCTDFDDIKVLEYGVVEQVYNQWYFGEQAGIEFSNGPLAILDGNNQNAEEGCATISDINGDLLFYTNGSTVWNKDHDAMVNGNLIGGEVNAAQNALIMPFGGDATIYYIFTTEQVYGDNEYALRYSIVDMKEDTARGKVIVKNVILTDNSSERVTGSGFTGNDVILSHDFGNNMFKAFQTSENGLSKATFSPVGEIHDLMNEMSATGYMKISPTLNNMAINIPGIRMVEIFDFDQGVVSNPRLIDTGEDGLYGLEFSPGGTKLYLTTSSGSGSSKLIQYDLDSLHSDNPAGDIQATKFDGYTRGSNYGALQTGPNGVIYMAVDNASGIGTINSPDGNDMENGFNPTGFDLQGRTSRLGLPNFSQTAPTQTQEASITVVAGCVGHPSVFSAVGRDPNNSIENYLWIFGDGTSANVQDTTHTYTNIGTYTVQMVLSNRCDTDTILTTTITINDIPGNPTVPTDTALCDQPVRLTAWPVDNPDFSYYWSTGETTREITVASAAIIDVAIINAVTGCSSDTLQVFLADARPTIDLGGDRTFCQNDLPVMLDARVIAMYSWAVDGIVSGSNRTFEIDLNTAGVFEYTVTATNSFGCIGRDTVRVTIQEEPDISVVSNPTSGCGLNDGNMGITFNTSGSFSYQVSGTSPSGPFNFDGPGSVSIPISIPPGNLSPGIYNLTVTNLVTGCNIVQVVPIEDPGTFNFRSSHIRGNCDGDVDLRLSSLPNSFTYEIQNERGIIVNSGTGNTDPLDILGQNTGTFTIRVTDNLPPGCIETEQIMINPDPEPMFTFDPIQEICGTQGQVVVTDESGGIATYRWNGPGIVGTNIGTTITVNQAGTYLVTVEAMTGFCPRMENITVNTHTDPIISIAKNGNPCEGQVTLIANVTGGSGTYLYNWSDNSRAEQNTVTTSGSYNVTVIDQLTNCNVTSRDMDVTIEAGFEVGLSLNPDCGNNGTVFVIATPNQPNLSFTYEWQDGNGNTLADTDSILTATQSNRYAVTVTNESGTCVATEFIDVSVNPINPEHLLLPTKTTFCTEDRNNPTVDLNPGIFNTYEWRLLPDQTVISNEQILNVSTEGTYEVTLYNGFTCITDQVQVEEDCLPVIFAPNAFSPNNSGGNETFFVFPNEYVDQFEILIYTRWGELVYRAENRDFQWNGIYKGKVLPPGTYAYVMKFSSLLEPELGTIEQYGSVTLIR